MTNAQLTTITTKLAQIAALAGGGAGAPTGAILLFGAAAAPTGYLACDGAAVSRATYAALFAIIATTWGSGDGSTTFNVPDLRGRAPVGVGTGTGLTARALATNYGAETVTLDTTMIPAHGHTVTDPGHTHGVVCESSAVTSAGAGKVAGTSTNTSNNTIANAAASNTTGITLANTGGGAAHANVPPIVGCTFCIKT